MSHKIQDALQSQEITYWLLSLKARRKQRNSNPFCVKKTIFIFLRLHCVDYFTVLLVSLLGPIFYCSFTLLVSWSFCCWPSLPVSWSSFFWRWMPQTQQGNWYPSTRCNTAFFNSLLCIWYASYLSCLWMLWQLDSLLCKQASLYQFAL